MNLVLVLFKLMVSEEVVAIAVPKRNIETWIAFLKGDNVDETQN